MAEKYCVVSEAEWEKAIANGYLSVPTRLDLWLQPAANQAAAERAERQQKPMMVVKLIPVSLSRAVVDVVVEVNPL